MDSVVFWIFLWLISTPSLNKIKLKLSTRFFCLACLTENKAQYTYSTNTQLDAFPKEYKDIQQRKSIFHAFLFIFSKKIMGRTYSIGDLTSTI
jgi:hypothetical protein